MDDVRIIVLSGPPLTGKSTLAGKLIARLNLIYIKPTVHIDIDQVRQEVSPNLDGHILPTFEERLVMVESYARLSRKALEKIENKCSVIITGTFSRDEFKTGLRVLNDYVKDKRIPLTVLRLKADDAEIERRLITRNQEGGLSPIKTMELYKWSESQFQQIGFLPITIIDTSESDHLEVALSVINKGVSTLYA